MMVCPNCGALVQEEYHTGGVVFQCSRCGFYQMFSYPSDDNSSTATGSYNTRMCNSN